MKAMWLSHPTSRTGESVGFPRPLLDLAPLPGWLAADGVLRLWKGIAQFAPFASIAPLLHGPQTDAQAVRYLQEPDRIGHTRSIAYLRNRLHGVVSGTTLAP